MAQLSHLPPHVTILSHTARTWCPPIMSPKPSIDKETKKKLDVRSQHCLLALFHAFVAYPNYACFSCTDRTTVKLRLLLLKLSCSRHFLRRCVSVVLPANTLDLRPR